MTDQRAAARATYAQWLRVRANVRALELELKAREHQLRREGRRSADAAEIATLIDQSCAARAAIEAFAAELDDRIANVKRDFDAVEAACVAQVVAAARTTSPANAPRPGTRAGRSGE